MKNIIFYSGKFIEADGKIKILDFTAIREERVSLILEAILAEVKAFNAKKALKFRRYFNTMIPTITFMDCLLGKKG